MKVIVSKVGLDWLADCPRHEFQTWCPDWTTAMELAYGHLCMIHHRAMGKDEKQEGAIK